ncbi:MAG: DUF421 domain-containing protein [Tepidiformaceae bacterium]
MFDLGTDWWEIILRTAVVYAAVLVGIRVTGKRQIGQMAPFDLVVIILIANAVQNAMVGPDNSLSGGLIAAAVLLGINFLVSRATEGIPLFRRVVEGTPQVLIAGGRVIHKTLRKEGVDMVELEQAVREHGIERIEEVQLAVLEVDGSISVVQKDGRSLRTNPPPASPSRSNPPGPP